MLIKCLPTESDQGIYTRNKRELSYYQSTKRMCDGYCDTCDICNSCYMWLLLQNVSPLKISQAKAAVYILQYYTISWVVPPLMNRKITTYCLFLLPPLPWQLYHNYCTGAILLDSTHRGLPAQTSQNYVASTSNSSPTIHAWAEKATHK